MYIELVSGDIISSDSLCTDCFRFLFFNRFICFMCMNFFCQSPGTGDRDGSEPPCRFWEPNGSSLPEQLEFVITKTSYQPIDF